MVLYTGRHTAGTLMREAGVPIKVNGDALGHRYVNTTAGTYVHASADLTRRAMDGYWRHLRDHGTPLGDATMDPTPFAN